MPSEKNTGAVFVKTSGRKQTFEVVVPTGTKLSSTLKVLEKVKVSVSRKFQPGGCLPCHSGRDYRIRETARVLPAKLGKNVFAFDLRSGELIEAEQLQRG